MLVLKSKFKSTPEIHQVNAAIVRTYTVPTSHALLQMSLDVESSASPIIPQLCCISIYDLCTIDVLI